MALSAPYDARAIANFLLDLAESRGVRLTQMALLKLIYFAHGWYLAIHNKPLSAHTFEAWQHGPVVKVVRDAFGKYRDRPITERACKLVLATGELQPIRGELSHQDEAFVASVFDEYRSFSAWQLSDITHEPESPWDRLWNSEQPVGRLALRIKDEEIRAHFRELPQRFQVS